MATETALKPKKMWQKLLIYWHTKDFSNKTYDIALIMAVAIYTNHKIYKEELQEAHVMLNELLQNEESAMSIMKYIEMKLLQYTEDEKLWRKEQNIVREIIKKNEEFYTYLINIFEADNKLDEEEKLFETSIRTSFSRS